MVTKPPTSEQQAANETTPSEQLEELARENVKLARLVAKNPSATSELLQELASSSDVTTRRGVATNPNAPSDVLLHLGAEFPEQLLNNTMFSLLLLENPNLLPDMPLATLRSLLKREAVPVSFLEWAAANHADQDVLLAVALNPNTPKTTLEKLIQNRSDVAEAARLHVNWAGEMSQGWDEAARTAIKTTNFLRRHSDSEMQLWVAGAIAELLLPVLSPTVQLAIAQNPNTSASLLEQLAAQAGEDIRLAIAHNPNTPTKLLEQLAVDRGKVFQAVLYHPNTSLTMLSQVNKKALDAHEVTNEGNNISIKLLEQLETENVEVRLAIAQNPNVS